MTAIVHLDQEQQVGYLEKGRQHESRIYDSTVARKKRKLRKQHLGIDSSSLPVAKDGMPKVPKMRKGVKISHPLGVSAYQKKNASMKDSKPVAAVIVI
jgi:hypothetical protein